MIVKEIFDSRKTTNDSGKKTMVCLYHVNTNDPYEAEQYGPAMYQSYGIDLYVKTKVATRLKSQDGWCLLEVTYATRDQSSGATPNQDSWEIDMSSQTVHVSHVEKNTDQIDYDVYGINMPSANVGTAIGKTDREIKGTDIYIPAETYRYTKWFYQSQISAIHSSVRAVRNKTNDANWKLWNRGEVLFLGARLGQSGNELVEVNFDFLIAENRQNISINMLDPTKQQNGKYLKSSYTTSVIVPEKKGWQYLWYRDKPVKLYNSSTDVKPVSESDVIISAHLSSLYREANFAVLGIGA
ncbi:MAG: hypothetical protein JXR97_09340 [Planctomycetes bacterium]|nr:hypothetical protein [Planctomycetota bacterium]